MPSVISPHPDLPAIFMERMKYLLSDEFSAFASCYKEPPTNGLRVNTLKLTPEKFLTLAPFHMLPISWCPAGFLLPPEVQPGKHPYHAAGLYYIQEPSAMAAAQILGPRPGERVLDLCAAPGGKATALAALMENKGLLIANEIHPQRVWDLAENLERCGVRIATITNGTPEQLAEVLDAFFDRVLIDAPCSGEGMFRKNGAARTEWKPALVQSCAVRQMNILNAAARMVRPYGWLAYTTCTFSVEENEAVVGRFLQAHPEFELVSIPDHAGFSPGRPDWAPNFNKYNLQRTIRLWPHRATGEGHFIALMRRSDEGGQHTALEAKTSRVPESLHKLYQAFWDEHINLSLPQDRMMLRGSYLYQLPSEMPDLRGLKVIHPGWWLGTIKKDRFEPAHALATGIQASNAQRSIDFRPDSADVLAYLHGESLTASGEDGWTLISVDGYPLGWGKRVKGVIKNAYPHGLRWL
jgi:NOL1/NOP2/sun family putative RNA methylase